MRVVEAQATGTGVYGNDYGNWNEARAVDLTLTAEKRVLIETVGKNGIRAKARLAMSYEAALKLADGIRSVLQVGEQ